MHISECLANGIQKIWKSEFRDEKINWYLRLNNKHVDQWNSDWHRIHSQKELFGLQTAQYLFNIV